jgi:predicted  nucleic acid-binding Zn-ribbon protein
MRNTRLARVADQSIDDYQNVIQCLIEEIEALEDQLEELELEMKNLNDEKDNLVLDNADLKSTIIQLQKDLSEIAKTFTSSL